MFVDYLFVEHAQTWQYFYFQSGIRCYINFMQTILILVS